MRGRDEGYENFVLGGNSLAGGGVYVVMIRMMNYPSLAGAAASLLLLVSLTPARAASADVIVMDDFESVKVGEIPAGFTKTGAIAVAEGVAHSGTHALKVEPAVKGGRFITLAPDKVAALGGEHWGRLYFKVKLPAAKPAAVDGKKNPSIHTTFVAGQATSPLANDSVNVRLAGFSLKESGEFAYKYNVQPGKARKEFGPSSKMVQKFSDDWTLLEWHSDYATQTYEFFVNGQRIDDISFTKGAGKFEGAEIPEAFKTLSIGWTNYQAATDEGFTVWIDDIAVGKKRLGPVAAK